VAPPADLRAWIALLEREGELVRIAAEVDPELEITEVTDRTVKAGGPALLFENVKGSEYPLLINQFGTERRMCMAFDAPSLDDVASRLADVPEIPERVVAYIAQQVDVDPAVFAQYGERDNTIFEHLDELRREFGFQNCGWPQLHALGQELMPLALESHRSLPLIETGVERLRA